MKDDLISKIIPPPSRKRCTGCPFSHFDPNALIFWCSNPLFESYVQVNLGTDDTGDYPIRPERCIKAAEGWRDV